MLFLRSLDSAFAAFAELNSDGQADGGWFWAATALAAPIFGVLMGFFPEITAIGKYQVMAILGPPAIGAMVLYGRLRRAPILRIRSSLPKPVPKKSKAIFAIFLSVISVGTILAARFSPFTAVCVMLLIACLPWARWASVPNAT